MTAEPAAVSARTRDLVVPAAWVVAAVLVAIAAALRLPALGWMPLDPGESAMALRALGSTQAAVAPPAPVADAAARLVFWLAGTTDATARLSVALAGILMVVLAAGLTPLLGRTGSIVAAGLVAVSPAWVFLSRHEGPAAIASASALAFVAASGAPVTIRRWAMPAAAALALGSGPIGLTAVVAGLVVLVIPMPGKADAFDWLRETWPGRPERLVGLAAFGGTLIVATTGFLTRPEGLAAVIETPGAWAGRFAAVGRGAGRGVLLPLLTNAPVETLFGVVGLIALGRTRPVVGTVLGIWAAVAAFVALLSGTPAAAAEPLLPLSLAAAAAVALLLDDLLESASWPEEGVMTMVLLAVAVFAWIQWLGLAGSGSADTAGGWLAWGSLAMLGLLIAAYLLLWGGGVARRVTAIASLAILAALGWSQGSRLAYAPARDLQEPLRPDFVSGEVRLLTRALSVRGMRTLAIQADPSLVPALAWEMRRFPSVSWGRSAGEAPPDAILRPAGAEPGTLEASYMGTTYRLVGHWRGPPAGLVGFARWYFQRRPPASTPAGIVEPVDYEPVELFLRIEP